MIRKWTDFIAAWRGRDGPGGAAACPRRSPLRAMRAPQTTPPRLTSAPYLLVAPLALVLVVFFGIPLLLVVIVSFFDLDKFDIIPTFVLTNYSELFGSSLTYALYAKT